MTLVATKRLNLTKIFQVQAFGCKILVEVVYEQNYLRHFKIAAILHTVGCKEQYNHFTRLIIFKANHTKQNLGW